MSRQSMTSRERVLSAFNRKGYDRIPVRHDGTPEINGVLMKHFGVDSREQLLLVLGDDFREIQAGYIGPELRTFPDGSFEGLWGERYREAEYIGGAYPEACYLPFADVSSLEDLDRSHFPSAEWCDYSSIRGECEDLHRRGFAVYFGSAGNMDFINGIARTRGMEQVLVDLITDDPVYMELMEARFRFYFDMHRKALEAAGGLIDFTQVGDDLGTQRSAVISMEIFEKHFAPKYAEYFKMAHSYGARVIMHMCGCVRAFLPRLIELGLDVYDVVQPTTPETDIAVLRNDFGSQLGFCGSVCVQSTLAFGTPQDVEFEVNRRLELFSDGGLFLGPTHAIQVGSPLENILALYRTAGSLADDYSSRHD